MRRPGAGTGGRPIRRRRAYHGAGQRRRGTRGHQSGASQYQPTRARLIVQLSADFTRSGENGTRRMRTPVASNIALAMAAATGLMDGSPAPLGGRSGWLISTTFTSAGVSVISRIG